MTPLRIRLSRAKGWRMPENTVKVDAATALGNPFRVGVDGTRQECAHLHRALMGGLLCLTGKATIEEQRAHHRAVYVAIPRMRGKNHRRLSDRASQLALKRRIAPRAPQRLGFLALFPRLGQPHSRVRAQGQQLLFALVLVPESPYLAAGGRDP